MPAPPAARPMQQSGCIYSVEEREIIGKWKVEYKAAPSKELQAHLFKDKILPAIFNFWTKDGTEPITGEPMDARVKALGRWIANNWRSDTKESRSVTFQSHITYIDIVCRDRMDAVLTEMTHLCDGECPEPGTMQRFTLRTKAAKLAYEHMTADEKAAIDQAVAEAQQFGGDLAVRHRAAAKKGHHRVEQWAKKSWLEMGMFMLTLWGYMTEDGRYAVDVYEDMANNMGVVSALFCTLYEDSLTLMLRRLGEYMKTLHNLKKHPAGPMSGSASEKYSPVVVLMYSPEGFPIIPDDSLDPLGKRPLVKLMWEFLHAHYALASGQRKKQVPFSHIEGNASQFVHDEYLPRGFIMKDPHNLRKEVIQQFFAWVREWQWEKGEKDSFQFHAYETEKGKFLPAKYPGTEQARCQPPGNRKRRGRGSGSGEQPCGAAKRRKDTGTQRQPLHMSPEPDNALSDTSGIPYGDGLDIGTSLIPTVAGSSNFGYAPEGQGGEYAHSTMLSSVAGPFGTVINGWGVGTEASGRSASVGEDVGTPAHWPSPMITGPPVQDIVIVSQSIAHHLQEAGLSIGHPINGPMEGDPQYTVLRSTLHYSAEDLPKNQNTNVPIDPVLTEIDNHQRRKTNDQLAQDEAQAVMGCLKGRRERRPNSKYIA